MIYIREKPSVKITGLTSLFISFNYNPDLVAILKASKLCSFNKDSKEWEAPLVLLSLLLDQFTLIDDIELSLYDEQKIEDNFSPILNYKSKPFDYQMDAINYGLNHDKFLLLDEAGLGKSLELIYLAEELRAQKGAKKCLIICGINTLKTNWEKEIAKHSYLDSLIIGKKISKKGRVSYTSIPERIEQLKQPINEFFTIVNIEMLRDENLVKAIINKKYDIIFFDECHKAKGWKSKQGKHLMLLEAPYQVAATGTLILNNPLDSYVPLVFINKESRRSVTKFKNTYCVFKNGKDGEILEYKNLDLLKEEILSCSLRRLKSEVLKAGTAQSLPSRQIIDRYIDMEPKHSKFYYNIVNGVKEECDKVTLKPQFVLAMVTRLRQATSCPEYLTSSDVTSSKVDYAIDLIEEITSNNEKVVIFSSYKEPLYQLYSKIKGKYNVLMNTGDTKDDVASQNIDRFQTNPKYQVFLGTVDKMGTGITLTAANNAIFIDQPWTEAIYSQACDRIYRIGQTKPVTIYNLICSNTIDEAVSHVLNRKKTISNFIIDDIVDDSTYNILSQYIQDL